MVLKEDFARLKRQHLYFVRIKDNGLMCVIKIHMWQDKKGIEDDHTVISNGWEDALFMIALNVTYIQQ